MTQPQRATREPLPRVMVLVYEPSLKCSVWQDCVHFCRSVAGIRRRMRKMIISGEIVGYRLMHVVYELVGL